MNFDYPLFLPNVTKASTTSNNRLTDEGVRLAEARKAFFATISSGHFRKIVIVDGSNTEVLTPDEINGLERKQIEVEQLIFQQDSKQVSLFGKSNGEMQITNHMLCHSRLIAKAGGFYKLSPRWCLDNINYVLPSIRPHKNIFYYFHPPLIRQFRPFICTSFYKSSVSFYERHLADCISECGLDVEGYLESVFYRRLQGLTRRKVFSEFLFFSGIGGSLGRPVSNRYYFMRNMMCKAGLLGYSFN